MSRKTIPIAALVLSAMSASCTGVSLRVAGVNVPSMTRERVEENPEHREPSGFPPYCHRAADPPTGPSPAPEMCSD